MAITSQRLTGNDPLVSKGAVCPYCGITYAAGDEIVRCPMDGATHHAECWGLNGDCCTTLGCAREGLVDDGSLTSISGFDIGSVLSMSDLSSNLGILSAPISNLGGSNLMSNMFGLGSSSNDYGALVVYLSSSSKGKTVTILQLDQAQETTNTYYSNVVERTVEDGKKVFVGIFPRVPVGNYRVLQPYFPATYAGDMSSLITVFPGSVSEVQF